MYFPNGTDIWTKSLLKAHGIVSVFDAIDTTGNDVDFSDSSDDEGELVLDTSEAVKDIRVSDDIELVDNPRDQGPVCGCIDFPMDEETYHPCYCEGPFDEDYQRYLDRLSEEVYAEMAEEEETLSHAKLAIKTLELERRYRRDYGDSFRENLAHVEAFEQELDVIRESLGIYVCG